MKPASPEGFFAALASPRLGQICAVLTGLCLVAASVLPQGMAITDPGLRHQLGIWGFADLLRSGWFIFVTSLLGLNLTAALLRRLPAEWRALRHRALPALHTEVLVTGRERKGGSKLSYARFATELGREPFRDLVQAWCRANIGKPAVLRDEGGLNELQLASEEGRFSDLGLLMAVFGALLTAASLAWSSAYGWLGRMEVEEGSRTGVLKLEEGRAPGWPVYRDAGQELDGYYEPGFEIELQKLDVEAGSPRAWVSVLKDGRLQFTSQVGPGRPVRFSGADFHLVEHGRSRTAGAKLVVSDRLGDVADQSLSLEVGHEQLLQGARFRVVDVRDDIEDFGAAVQLEYQEIQAGKDLTPEQFWLFSRYPGFDSAHRKKSHYLFALRSVDVRHRAVFRVSHHPGMGVAAFGGVLLVLGLFFGLFSSRNRVYFSWVPGGVLIAGQSERELLFTPRFEGLAESFRKRLARADKTLKTVKTEVKTGVA